MSKTKIQPTENGPYVIEGELEFVDADGNVVREETKVWLCRCGQSATKPFCDGSHRREGFVASAMG